MCKSDKCCAVLAPVYSGNSCCVHTYIHTHVHMFVLENEQQSSLAACCGEVQLNTAVVILLHIPL